MGSDDYVKVGYLIYTTDSGGNWIQYGNPMGFLFGISDFYFSSLDEGWVADRNRGLFYTNDLGQTWDTLQSYKTLPGSVGKFFFIDKQNAWAITAQEILKTNDGWQSFTMSGTITDLEFENTILTNFSLIQNYPNPFNPTTKITYTLPEISFVTLKVYDLLGNEIATLVNEDKSAGRYEVSWDAKDYTSGIYFYQFRAKDFVETKKMLLIK